MTELRSCILPIVVVAGSLAGCGAPTAQGPGTVRFVNRAPVAAVNDRQDVPEKPDENPFAKNLYHFDGHVHRRLTRWMEMRGSPRAANVNSLDEVPNSTWFTNRIGVRSMTIEEIKNGPGTGDGSPENHRPWKIVSSKVGGASVGFIIEDARGERYLLKFDAKGWPETDTAADVILARLLHAVGFNVPEDYIVYFHRKDLVLADDAVVKDPFGNKSPLTEAKLEANLARVNIEEDGSIRGLASKFISGKPLGGTIRDWTREDDPNDRIPHYLRREIRGQYSIFAWLDHADIKEDNTLDVYAEDPGNPEIHYVKHYLLDFGNALGVQGMIKYLKYVGFSFGFDFAEMGKSLASLGIYKRRWEDRTWPQGLKGIGLYSVSQYHPDAFKSYSPSYFPFHDADVFDKFWGAKILIHFTPEQIRAAVEEARYSDPRATEYMIETLVTRQRITARYWFDRVNPLDAFAVERDGDAYRVCFDDLMVVYGLDEVAPQTRYAATAFDYEGRATGWSQADVTPGAKGRTCMTGVRESQSTDGYTILRFETRRPGREPVGPLHLHLARGDEGTLRIIGLRRH